MCIRDRGEGSRVRYALLVAGAEDDVTAFNDAIEDMLPDEIRVRSQEESSERAYNAADRAQRFLSCLLYTSPSPRDS